MTKFKRLYFDIETSYNQGSFWRAGYKLNITPDQIIKERAIICVCYKWEGDKKTHSLEWNKGDDKKLLQDFIKIMNEADEVIGHNSDRFDITWLRTRCLLNKIPMVPEYNSVDTLKLSKKYFNFNSNKLDYISSLLGFGHKLHTGLELWDKIILNNDPKAMAKMVKYCKQDVVLLEKVHQALVPYVKHKTHVGVLQGGSKIDCPECGSTHVIKRGRAISTVGVERVRLSCNDCGKWFSVLKNVFMKEKDKKENKDRV